MERLLWRRTSLASSLPAGKSSLRSQGLPRRISCRLYSTSRLLLSSSRRAQTFCYLFCPASAARTYSKSSLSACKLGMLQRMARNRNTCTDFRAAMLVYISFEQQTQISARWYCLTTRLREWQALKLEDQRQSGRMKRDVYDVRVQESLMLTMLCCPTLPAGFQLAAWGMGAQRMF